MNHTTKSLILSSIMILAACSSMTEEEVLPTTVEQLSGSWISDTNIGNIYFYADETAKLIFPDHQPAIKFIAPYQQVKENKIGIALGGFWSGPVLIDTSDLANHIITATFPDEEPIRLHKK